MKPIIFVCGHRKGGTSMFHNLFDGHSDVSVYPVDVNVLYGYFPQYTNGNFSADELTKRLENVVFKDIAKIPLLQEDFQFDNFRETFFNQVNGDALSDISKVLSGLLESYANVHYPDRDYKYHLLKETSIELYASELSKKFANSKFLHLIRDPRDNFAAIKSGLNVKYEGYGDSKNTLLFSVINRALYGFKMAFINQQLLGEHTYRAVRFEDVVSRPEEVMGEVCEWLELPYEDCLVMPSIMGKMNQGNNFDKKKFTGVNTSNMGRWKERIDMSEAALIELMFDKEMEAFGYSFECDVEQKAQSMGEFYKWANYKYFYHDRFAD